MASFNRLSVLSSYGDLAVNGTKASGDKVFTGDKKYPVNAMTGEIVVFDGKNNSILSDADIATAQWISVAVGIGKKGQLASDLRYIAGEVINLCEFEIGAEVAAPVCPLPQILDVFFDGTDCTRTPTIMFTLDDALVRNQYGYNERARYPFSVNDVCECDSCTAEENCQELVCKFVDAINHREQEDPRKLLRFQNRDISDQYQPFHAARLWNKADSVKSFCIPVEDTACEDCDYVAGITGISLDGVVTTFDFTTVPGDTSQTKLGQLERVIYLTNKALDETGGYAYMAEGIGDCCDRCIEISTCIDAVLFTTAAGTIAPTNTANPFESLDVDQICRDCDVTPGSLDITCGFRVFVDPVSVECMCDLPANGVPNYYGRTLKVEFTGEGWECSNTHVKEVQKQVLPEGFGFFWQDREQWQHNGGSGRDYRYSNKHVGRNYKAPDKFSRVSNTHVDCEGTYCIYNLVTTVGKRNKHNNAWKRYNTDHSDFLVPSKDAVTIPSWETYLNALYQRGICTTGNIECDLA